MMQSSQRQPQLARSRGVGQSRQPQAVVPMEPKVRGAADVDRDARAASDVLRNMLKTQPPWTREIEFQRQKARNLYLTLIFSHPLSTYAQSLDGLWHHSTYALIASFRELIARAESSLPQSPGAKGRKHNPPAQVELRKVLTRFRQALSSEEGFYRGIVSRIVAFYQLQALATSYLSSLGIPVQVGVPGGGAEHGLAPGLGVEEKREKLGLVYKGLICLGDLERYKEQYSDRARREMEGGRDRDRGEERFVRAKTYYEVARGLQPDDGSAFNQLAVISTYVGDDLLCVYYYFRALAVKQAFKNIEEILDKFLRKVYERWHAGLESGHGPFAEGQEAEGPLEEFRREYLVVVTILFRRSGTSHIPALKSSTLSRLNELLRNRSLPSETIVKMTAITIGSHWYARQSASVAPMETDPKRVRRRHDTEEIALEFMMAFFGVFVETAADELNEMAQEHVELHQQISAVLRRLLPALRIMSKWVKLHLEYIYRFSSTSNDSLASEIQTFWSTYHRLTTSFTHLFPLAELPTLTDHFEEDLDMRGFAPFNRGLSLVANHDNESNGHGEAPHPNEEQLMRIADLQVDAKLLMHSETGLRAMSGNTTALVTSPTILPATFASRSEDDADIASVSTETEDDPVNLAMRASLGGSSVDEEEHRGMDDENEVIVWGQGSQTPVSVHANGGPAAKAPTAYDLLQNLMLDTGPVSPAPRPVTVVPGQFSPRTGLLFGGEPGGTSIWTMTREESEKGTKRGARASAGNLANVKNFWNESPAPTTKATSPGTWAGVQHTPTPRAAPPNHIPTTGGHPDPIWAGYMGVEGYQQYYEVQPTPYAQWGQAYHRS